MNPDLDTKYNRFVGQKIAVVTIGTPPYSYQDVDDKDPVYLEFAAEAAGDGLSIRTWFPDTVGTMDYNLSRVNIVMTEDGTITQLYLG